MDAWKDPLIVDNFLTKTRQARPFGTEQLDILLRLISNSN